MSEDVSPPGREFVVRYCDGRREILSTTQETNPEPLFLELARAALPHFAHWAAVVNPASRTWFTLCTLDHLHTPRDCAAHWSAGLDLGSAIATVSSTGQSLAWHTEGAGHRGVISPLNVEDQPAGVVIVARDSDAPPWSADDLAAIQDVVTALGVDLERLRLRHQSRLALRSTQRVASQLHQLISASLAVSTLNDESEIVLSLARSARSVFDADRAIVSLGAQEGAIAAMARRGRSPQLLHTDSDRDNALPRSREDAHEPWSQDGWLCAPVLDTQRRSRGVVAARRTSAVDFSDEDRELAMLLGQLAATSLESLELNRTIQENETRLRILVDAAPVCIVESDATGHVRWWNRSASRLLKWPDFTEETTDLVRWPEEVQLSLAQLWSDLLSGGMRDTQELAAVVGGRERLLAVSAAVVPSGEKNPNVLTLLDDVTDQRELREEVRHAHRMELRGQVASTVAHDFNNLITLILGYSELLERNLSSDDKSIELVRDIQATSARASTLTAQLQSIGRTSAPAPVSVEIEAALSSNAEVLERIMGSKNTVVWELTAHTPAVTIDADLFEQMILNLSLNARDAMPEGGTLTFRTEVREVPCEDAPEVHLRVGAYVVLSIADSGAGMDDATLARCFEPLFTTKGPFQGTGLGLTSARRLVEDSGGTITCTSTFGTGTTFTIWLPVPVNAPALDPADVPVSTPPPRARIEASVLLVEDDPGLRRLARQVLVRNGLEVHEAGSSEEAMEIYRGLSEPVDMLVSDVVLPQMDGIQLAAALQEQQPELLVVMMSGTASAKVLGALHPGTATFLAKPFRPSQLVDQVVDLLSRRDAHYAAGSKR